MKAIYTILGILILTGGIFIGTKINSPLDTQVINQPTAIPIKFTEENSSKEKQDEKNIDKENEDYRNVASSINGNYTSQELETISLFEKSAPSVVFINTSSLRQDRWSMDIFEIPQGSGTGFIWDEYGHIVTNHHVIEGSQRVSVTLSDQKTYDATVIGTEPNKDLAVLRIMDPKLQLSPIPIGSSANLRVGQSVYAIGNPFGLDQSLTTGIISALGREIKTQNNRTIEDVIQSDAAINPGNSGGPLLDSGGKLIGVNTAIYSPSGASAGIGFSIPVDEVKYVVPDIIKYGEVRRPILGINLVPNSYFEGQGAMIKNVGENTPAKKAGLQGIKRASNGAILSGDVIIAINGERIKSNNELILNLESKQIGQEIRIEYVRKNKTYTTNVILASSVNR